MSKVNLAGRHQTQPARILKSTHPTLFVFGTDGRGREYRLKWPTLLCLGMVPEEQGRIGPRKPIRGPVSHASPRDPYAAGRDTTSTV